MSANSLIPSHVFGPVWIAEQKRKYENRPEYARPTLYHLWTSDECQGSREIIERWVDLLTAENRRKVIPRLRRQEQFEQTYNELADGDSLRRMGHSVEYEVELNGLTPDWFVRPAGAGRALILEVVSSKPPQQRERCDDGWDGLRLRLEGMPGNAVLSIQPPFHNGSDEIVPPPSSSRQKQIARAVQSWLETGPIDGEGFPIDGIVIRFIGRNPNGNQVGCGISCTPFWVDAAPLRESVEEKAGKYRELVQALKLPFVVCVIPDFESGRRLNDLQKAVLGQERCRMVQDSQGAHHPEYYRENDGLFAKYPTLSAVTLGQVNRHKVTHTLLRNPTSTYPLAELAFPPALSCAEDA